MKDLKSIPRNPILDSLRLVLALPVLYRYSAGPARFAWQPSPPFEACSANISVVSFLPNDHARNGACSAVSKHYHFTYASNNGRSITRTCRVSHRCLFHIAGMLEPRCPIRCRRGQCPLRISCLRGFPIASRSLLQGECKITALASSD